MDLTIIIPVFNEVESITSLLDEIAAQFDETDTYEVIVVDNGSDDDSVRLIEERFPQVTVVPLDSNNRILVQQGLQRIRSGRCRPTICSGSPHRRSQLRRRQ